MSNKKEIIIDQVPFVGEDGLNYLKVTKEIHTPRKTYLKGRIIGKYRGDKIDHESDKSILFDFAIYEAEVFCNSLNDFRKNKPFKYPKDFKKLPQNNVVGTLFPKEKLPSILPVQINSNENFFGVNIIDPQLFEFNIEHKLHQTDGDEVFGTFKALITGYILDYEKEVVESIHSVFKAESRDSIPRGNLVETGRIEKTGDYIRKEYKYENLTDVFFGEWVYNKKEESKGCLPQLFTIIGLIIALYFIIKFFPFLLFFLIFYLALALVGYYEIYFKWIFRILGAILLMAFISALFNSFNHRNDSDNSIPLVVDSPREVNPIVVPNDDNSVPEPNDNNRKPIKDSLITRFRSWKDYSGKNYSGKYQIKLSDFTNSHNYKNGLNANQNTIKSYDGVVYNLKEHDKSKINSLFNLFDSLRIENKLNSIKFAEMIVSFVQDIPYALILDDACDASLYQDRFIRSYLLNKSGDCFGYQKFGINTPLEFLTNLKGDCDTRTLLLYTILSHYNYDVTLLSSEFYGHSILGVNLPINGTAYLFNNHRYVLWETTSPNKPGVISAEISNLNYWRISLKSK